MLRDKHCNRCRLAQSCRVVCNITSQKKNEVMVVGESPATRGNHSHILEMLNTRGIKPFFASAVNCEPPDRKKPTDSQVASCRYYLKRQIKRSGAKFVLLMGNASLYAIKNCKGINKERGRPFEKNGVIYLPTWTQGYIYHDPQSQMTIGRDLDLFADIIEEGGIPREKRLKYTLVDTRPKLIQLLVALKGNVSFDIEGTGLFPWMTGGRITTIQFGTRNHQYVVPINHAESPWHDPKEVTSMIDEQIKKNKVRLITHNGKFDYLWMLVHFGVRWHDFAYFDTLIAHYLLDENNQHGLKELAQKYLGAPDWDVDKDIKIDGPLPELAFYGAHDVYYTRKLKGVFNKLLKKEPEVCKVFRHIMMPVIRMFVDIEYNGVYINTSMMDDAREDLIKRIEEIKKELDQYGNINWGSPPQLCKLFFEDLKLPVIERTEKGNPSVSESVLKRMEHPIAGLIIKYRGAKQQLAFFIEGWKPYLVGKYLHPSFKLHGTVTGRPSCENPNLQQVPRDGFIRNLVDAPPGWELIEADLSQIELCVAADLAQAKSMLKVFKAGGDLHWLTAITDIGRGNGMVNLVLATGKALAGKKESYSKSLDLILKAGADRCIALDPQWKDVRYKGKPVNFGFLYGMWWKNFKVYARDTYGVNITNKQAKDSRKNFFYLYPELEAWHNRQKRVVAAQGFVHSLSGRKRRLPIAMQSDDTPAKRGAQRQAINFPVQSFANELNLMAALQLHEEYNIDKVRICGTVHDAILCIVKQEYVAEVYTRILEIMSSPRLLKKFNISMSVPIRGEAKIGPWGKGVSLEQWQNQQNSQKQTRSLKATKKSKIFQRSVAVI